MIVMKFGGTSVANKEAIQRAISIVRGRLDQRPVVVVSAMSKVTDSLYRIAGEAAAQHEAEIASLLDQLRNRHIDTASELLADSGHFLNEAISDINMLDGPTKGTTFSPRRWAIATTSAPGSAIAGHPASEITPMELPSIRGFR